MNAFLLSRFFSLASPYKIATGSRFVIRCSRHLFSSTVFERWPSWILSYHIDVSFINIWRKTVGGETKFIIATGQFTLDGKTYSHFWHLLFPVACHFMTNKKTPILTWWLNGIIRTMVLIPKVHCCPTLWRIDHFSRYLVANDVPELPRQLRSCFLIFNTRCERELLQQHFSIVWKALLFFHFSLIVKHLKWVKKFVKCLNYKIR